MPITEIHRNLHGNFELVFSLHDPTTEEFVSGLAADLDSNTIIIAYHNATVWTTTTFASGTPVEISSTGFYHITILASWFTARNKNFPIIIEIIDDEVTKQWKDIGVTINSVLGLEKVDVISNSGSAVDIESNNDIAVSLIGDGNALRLQSISDTALAIYSGTYGIEIYGGSDEGIYVYGEGAIKLESGSTNPVLNIDNYGTGKAVSITNNNATNAALDITNAGAGKDIDAKELTNILRSTDTIDGTQLDSLLSILKGSIIGKYALDTPDPGKLTIFANDNTTPLVIVTLTDILRTRNLPV